MTLSQKQIEEIAKEVLKQKKEKNLVLSREIKNNTLGIILFLSGLISIVLSIGSILIFIFAKNITSVTIEGTFNFIWGISNLIIFISILYFMTKEK